MWIKDEKGLSSAEILIAFAFLGIMVFFSYQMLMRQRRVVIKVNQNLEATTILYEMRKSLSGAGCKENLAGYSRILNPGTIKFLKRLIRFEDGTSEIEQIYPIIDIGGDSFSETGLKIKSYELNPRGLNESLKTDKTYLLVDFHREEAEGPLRKQIRLYTKETNGVITNCSLVPFANETGSWAQVGKELQLKVKKLGVGTLDLSADVNILGGLNVSPPVGGCNSQSFGSIYFNNQVGYWELCTNRGVIPLVDKRVFP